jgi:hypothetical protein
MVHRALETEEYTVYTKEAEFTLTAEQVQVLAELLGISEDQISKVHIHGPKVTIIHAFTAEDNK